MASTPVQSAEANWIIDGLAVLQDEDVALDDVVEAGRLGEDAGPVFDDEAVVQDQPVLVHAAHPEAGLGRGDIAVVDDVARAVGAVRGVARAARPTCRSRSRRCPWTRLDHALLEQVLVGPAGVPLGVAVVEDALADDAAAGGPLEERRVAQLEGLDVLHQAVAAAVPAAVGRAAAALEPGVVEDAIADLAPLGVEP